MKTLARLFAFLRLPIDLVIALLAVPSGLLLRLYRTLGSANLPMSTSMLRTIGVFPIRRHYYEPQFDNRTLRTPPGEPRDLPGIAFRHDAQLELLSKLQHGDEFREFVEAEAEAVGRPAFSLDNKNFRSGDADFLFQFIRHVKPATMIEIGSGSSTLIAAAALRANRDEDGVESRHVCIEPYESPWLETLDAVDVIRNGVETAPIDWSADLGPGDLLFIDSSHVIRPQGDVLCEYLEILPSLQSGVFVHVHDIFSPRDYLENWLCKDVLFWNEQYLLEATLGNTSRYEIVAALNYLHYESYDELQRVCPYLTPDREPGSFYFRVR